MEQVTHIIEEMASQLAHVVPDLEFRYKAELIAEIRDLKRQKNALILGHNYMEPALYHMVADVRGDSLELSRKAAETDAPIIVFCGVEFMAETAKILNPSKKVLIPSKRAGCSLASSITAEDVRELKRQYPDVPVVTYINTYADVKAETDICCTSGNAAQVVRSLNTDKIIFIPDEFLARNVAQETGTQIIVPTRDPIQAARTEVGGLVQKTLIGWHGRCEVHEKFTVEDIANARKQFPDVVVLSHPECPPDVVAASDFSGSTSRMISYVKERKPERILLLTECAMADNIIAETGTDHFLRMCNIRCPHMAQITLEQTRDALLYEQFEVTLDPDMIERARQPLVRMLAIS
jgi:quinolinate synthase